MLGKPFAYFLTQIGPNSEYTWTRLVYSALKAPTYHLYFEFILIIGIIWLLFKRSYRINDVVNLKAEERLELVKEWKPDSLVPDNWVAPKYLLNQFHKCAFSALGKYVDFNDLDSSEKLDAKNVNRPLHLNFATLNFLNFIGNPDLAESAIRTMKNYGVGSCGPRGFYGTFDVHLELEKSIAQFLRVEKAIIYSYAAATVSSAIPSYAKRTDVIFADEGISQAAYQGLIASRSQLKFFRHNDMEHLEHLLKLQAEKDKQDPKRALLMRKFFAVDALYLDYADMCPLKKLIELKYKYKVRILLDETISFGVLGSTGRGITEYCGVDINDIDLISGSFETAIGVCGGFCAGSQFVVGHQELSGQGYCFSASLPPMLASATNTAIIKLQSLNENGRRNRRLLQLARTAHHLFHSHDKLLSRWQMFGDRDSPVKHLRLKVANSLDKLERVVEDAFNWTGLGSPILLTVARYTSITDRPPVPPSIRIALNCDLTNDELNHLFKVLESLTIIN